MNLGARILVVEDEGILELTAEARARAAVPGGITGGAVPALERRSRR